jgi:hypothetical protein
LRYLTRLLLPLALIVLVVTAPLTATAAGAAPSTQSGPTNVMKGCSPGLGVVALGSPDASVDPATATAAQLAAAGYPPRPTLDTQAWVADMKAPHTFICPKFGTPVANQDVLQPTATASPQCVPGCSTGVYNPIWAGNVDNLDRYNQVASYWNVPTITADGSQKGTVLIWDGLGNANPDPLIQAGSAQDALPGKTPNTPYLWWEIITQGCRTCGLIQVANQPLKVNDKVIVIINYYLVSGTYYGLFWIENKNATVDKISYFYASSQPLSYSSGSQAEWILEKPPGLYLGKWSGAVTLNSDTTSDVSTGQTVCAGIEAHQSVYMGNATTNLAYPAAWTDPGTYCNFPIYRGPAT